MILNETYTLSNSVKIPKLGLGTWMLTDSEAAQAVRDAVAMGYRHIDTAQAYGNEAGVGDGVRTCGVARDELFVTSKVAAENKSYDSAAQSIDETLRKAGLDYIDMMIIHSPQPWAEFRGEKRCFEENREVWRALEDAYKAGKGDGACCSRHDPLEHHRQSCRSKTSCLRRQRAQAQGAEADGLGTLIGGKRICTIRHLISTAPAEEKAPLHV